MDDRSWLYRDLPQRLQRIDYCNGVQGLLIMYPRNISGCGIKCPCKRCKNKKLLDPDVIMMHLLQKKKFMEKIRVLIYTQRTICFL
jgi:hypothetical protein